MAPPKKNPPEKKDFEIILKLIDQKTKIKIS